jgi:hypothetical protein
MVPRYPTAPDGTLSTVHINRNLAFTSGADGIPTTKLSRRAIVFSSGGRDDFCSETIPEESFGSDAPRATDCRAIKNYMETIDGHFTVQPGDFSKDGWAIIASSGTCSFGIKFELLADTRQVIIGTNDVHFYINGWLGDAKHGKLRAVGTITCNNDGDEMILNWGLIHS